MRNLLDNLFGKKYERLDHFFIYAKSQLTSIKFEFGRYALAKSRIISYDIFEDLQLLILNIGKSNPKPKGILFYIHGFMADTKIFEEMSGKLLHDTVFSNITSSYDVIISLKWSSTLEYHESVNMASNKGRSLFYLVTQICDAFPGSQFSFINHSMGNRVFEGFIQELVKEQSDLKLEATLMFAPDLEHNVFFTTLSQLNLIAQKTFLFYNSDDRTLGVAKMIQKHERLGIYGHEDNERLPANIYQIDTTGLKDNEGLGPKLSLHRYYYASPSIRSLIISILTKQKSISFNGKVIY